MKRKFRLILLVLTLGLLSSCGDSDTIDLKADFAMKATVINVSDKIEVDVYDAEYAEGLYWIVFDDNTKVIDEKGKKISIADINPNDKIQIEYNGQVMMSYPPQVYAISIKKIK